MTSPAAPTTPPEGYPTLLEALVALGIVRAVGAYDGIIGDTRVADLPPALLDLLVDVLAVSVYATNTGARALATLHVDAVVAEAREAPVRPSAVRQPTGEPDRLRAATRTLLERVAAAEREREEADRQDRARRLDAEQAEAEEIRDAEDRALDAEIAAERAREEAEDAAEDARLAAERAALDRERKAEDEAERASIAAARKRDVAAERAEKAAEDRAFAEADARARREDRERRRQLADARRAADAAQARQQARARVARLARAEAYRAADEAAQAAAEVVPDAVLGWVRVLGPSACPTCHAWWDERPFGVVRPMSVRMKRHVGCDCTRRLVIAREELKARGYTDKPERVSARWRRAQERERDAERAAAGADAGG